MASPRATRHLLPPLDVTCSATATTCLEDIDVSARHREEVASAAASAAREAVSAAFAELQTALLQAVSAQLSGGRERCPSVARSAVSLGTCCSKFSQDTEQAAAAAARERFADTCSGCGSGSEHETPFRKTMSVTSGKSLRFVVPDAGHSEDSGAPTSEASSTRLSHSPPTVQSLQADIAQAVLQRGGFGAYGSGRSGSRRSTRKRSASRPMARFLPEADVRAEDAARARRREAGRDEGGAHAELPCTIVGAADGDSPPPSNSTSGLWSMSTKAELSLHRMSSSEVLKARCNELAFEATQGSLPALGDSDDGDDADARPSSPSRGKLPRSVPTVMMVFGLLPWDVQRRPRLSVAWQWACRAILALSMAAFFLLSFGYIDSNDCRTDGNFCWQRNGFLSQLPLPVGAFIVVTLVALQRHQNALEETMALLLSVSFERRYQAWHSRRAFGDKVVFVAIWFCAVLAACIWDSLLVGAEMEHIAGRGVLRTAVTSIFSGFILCFAYGMVHVCRSLSIMIDAFCCDVVHQESPQRVAHIWNMTQAILRKASVSVEHCLLGLCFVLVFAVPLLLVDVLHNDDVAPILTMIPTLFVTCGILYVLLLASTISEQCARVPALVNALSFGDGTESARQQTVDYISSSAAGFYVFGTRLTTATVLKFMYIWCIIVLGLLTRLSTS